MSSARIAINPINEDEGKSTRAGVSEVDQINRGQPRLNQAFGSKPNARQLADGGRARVPSRRSTVGGDLKRANLTHFDLVVNK